MHPFARKAAQAALAANRQGKFWEMSHKLFESGNALSDEKIQEIARELKLNMETFNRDMNDTSVQAIILRDMNEGGQAEIQGTPSLFVNGKLTQLRSPQEIEQTIESEMKAKK